MTNEQIEAGAKALYESVPWHQGQKPVLWDDLDKHEPELCEIFRNDSRTYFLAALAFIREQAEQFFIGNHFDGSEHMYNRSSIYAFLSPPPQREEKP